MKETLHFKLYEFIKKELPKSFDKPYYTLSEEDKLKELNQQLRFLIKQLETKCCEIDIKLNYKKILGELIMIDDINNIFVDNSFDSLVTNTSRSRDFNLKYGDEVLKVNWKNVTPQALTKEVSFKNNQIKKYIENKVSLILIVKNSNDPNYYTDHKKLYFPNGKITVDGFQYYLIHYKDLCRGATKKFYNRYFSLDNSDFVKNLGLTYREKQLRLPKEVLGDDKTV